MIPCEAEVNNLGLLINRLGRKGREEDEKKGEVAGTDNVLHIVGRMRCDRCNTNV